MTRGEANKNPCNIRISGIPWQGKITPSEDPDFEQFDTDINGIRAGAKLLVNYYTIHGLRTVAEIISRWAPDTENNTKSYINDVSSRIEVAPDDEIDLSDPAVLGGLVKAIITHENGGNIYSDQDIDQAVTEVLPLIV